VGCGTGALTSSICEACDPASVVACDPSDEFIEHARRNVLDPRASFHVARADSVPGREAGYDVAVSGLVLNFLPDPEVAVRSFCERLRASGVVAAYVWDYSDGMEFLRAFWDEAVAWDPRAAALDEGNRFPLCREPELAALMRGAGLDHVQTKALQVSTTFATFDDYWTPFLRGTGPAPAYVSSLDHAGREGLKARLRHRLRAGSDGEVRLRARAWAVRGVTS